MKKLLLIVLLSSTLNATFVTEVDKQKHFAVSAVVGFTSSNIAYHYGYTKKESFWIGFGSAMIVGLGKELYDNRIGGSGFDIEDLGADALGATFGSSAVFIIYRW